MFPNCHRATQPVATQGLGTGPLKGKGPISNPHPREPASSGARSGPVLLKEEKPQIALPRPLSQLVP